MCRGRLFNLLSAVICLFGSFPPVCWWVVFGVVLCLVYCFGGVLGFVLCGFWWCLGAVLPLVCLSGSWSVRCFLCCSCGGFACVVVCMVFWVVRSRWVVRILPLLSFSCALFWGGGVSFIIIVCSNWRFCLKRVLLNHLHSRAHALVGSVT